MRSGSMGAYRSAGALGPQDPPDDCEHGVPENVDCCECLKRQYEAQVDELEDDLVLAVETISAYRRVLTAYRLGRVARGADLDTVAKWQDGRANDGRRMGDA